MFVSLPGDCVLLMTALEKPAYCSQLSSEQLGSLVQFFKLARCVLTLLSDNFV